MKNSVPLGGSFVVVLAMLLSGCGSVSGMTAQDGSNEVYVPVYETAIVVDFKDASNAKGKSEQEIADYRDKIEIAGRHFADLIAVELKLNNLYAIVLREPTGGDELIISGDITRYQEGSSAARLLIGFGAGSSYFDAVVNFHASETGEKLGQIIVDKNSWALGGGWAAGQTVESYMQSAAEKIASELIEYRNQQVAQVSQ